MKTTGLNETHEEILESVWKAAEMKSSTLESIRKKCAVEFALEDIFFLEENGLIVKSGGRVLFLEEGKRLAEKIVRRHRIAEVLLSSILKLKHAEMEKIACKVEHSLLPEVEEAICTLLGHPEYCPDGNPIPKGACCKNGVRVVSSTVIALDKLKPGESGKVTYIRPDSHSNLEQLISLGLSPGVVVTLLQKRPVCCIKFDQTELALDRQIAGNIFLWKLA